VSDVMTSRHAISKTRPVPARVLVAAAAILGGLLAGSQAATAQTKAPPPRTPTDDRVALDPIKCWWRSAATAVVVGERFAVTLTCGIVETGAVKTVINRDTLEPAALTLTPFEVVGGTRREDVVRGPWRYFQYEYNLRVLGDEFFDREVPVPGLGINYHIVSTATETQEREHTYTLPPLPMKIVSLVPKQASGLREAAPDPFETIESHRFRSTTELVAAAVATGFALLLFGIAAARTVGRYRERRPQRAATVTAGAALRGALRATSQVKHDVARDGWNPETAGRALAPLRLAAAVGVGRPIAQAPTIGSTALRDGQVLVRSGVIRRRRVIVSGAAGAETVVRSLGAPSSNGRPPARTSAELDAIADSLRVFSAARYGRNGTLDTTALEAALANAEDAIRKLSLKALLPFKTHMASGGAEKGPEWFR
jgi:hypothetical protein